MTKEECREMGKLNYPVVALSTATRDSEIVYRRILRLQVEYASDAERARGFPVERFSVVVEDQCGRSETCCLARQLRFPTVSEAMSAIPDSWKLDRMDQMIEYLNKKAGEAEGATA
ncbi:MAG: hypothetical protein J6V24_03845 [Clostridia bacterium]|nr:hypothetical protein [Clostridia bacterium]